MDGDQSLVGLFTDSDSAGFLDELTGSDIGLGGTSIGEISSGMNPFGMPSHPQQPSQQSAQAQPPSFMGALGNQTNQMQQQQQQPQSQYGTDFNQFGSPKAFMNDAGSTMGSMGMQRMVSPSSVSSQPHMMSPSSQQPQMVSHSPQPGMMSPSPRIMSPSPQQQNQYGSPPGNNHMTAPGYGQYPVHNSPRMTPPRPGSAPMMNQPGMWSQGQPGASYMPGQGGPQSQRPPAPSYMGHQGQQHMYHDYPNQTSQQQQYSSFDQQTGQYPNQMNSPPANPASHHLSRMGQMQASSMGMTPSQRMMSFPQQNPMVRQNFPDSSPMQPSQSVNSGHLNNSSLPRYPPYQQQSMGGHMMRPDAPPLSHYPQSSTNQTSYHQPYGGMGAQSRAPFPTPPTSQGNYPSGMGMDHQFMSSSASQFPPQQQPHAYSSVSMTQNTNTHGQYSSANAMHNGTPMSSTGPVNSSMMGASRPMANTTVTMASSMSGPMVNTSMSSGMGRGPGPGPMSPNVNNLNPQALNAEINQLQQQVNQLYNMPQTPQTQQKMLDCQERLRTLKAQQQQLLMQQQRLQQQPGVMRPGMTPGMTQQQNMTQQPMLRPGMGQQQQPPQMNAQQHAMAQGPPMQPKPGMGPQGGPSPGMGPSLSPNMGPAGMNQQGPVPPGMNQVNQNVNQPNVPQSQAVAQMPGPPQQAGIRPPPGMMNPMNQPQRPPMGPGNATGLLLPHQQQHSPRPQAPNQGVPSPAMPMSPMAMSPMTHRMPVPQQPSQQPPMMQPQPPTQQPVPGATQPLLPGQPLPVSQDGLPAVTPPMNGMTPTPGVPNTNGPGSTMVSLLGQPQPGQPQANGDGQPLPSTIPDPTAEDTPTTKKKSKKRVPKSEKAQEKANKIISEAIAKATAEGKTIPKTVDSDNLDNSEEGTEEDGKKKKPKKPRTPRPKKDKAEKEKEKAEKEKEKAEKEKEKAEKAAARQAAKEAAKEERAKAAAEKKQKFVPKPKSSKKKKPPATFLKSKKRKRKNSDDGSDGEVKIEEPLSAKEDDDDFSNKRRSARNTKRKKYLDDIDLNLSEDESALKPQREDETGAVIRPDTVQHAPEEDVLLVEKILGSRIGKRAIPKIKEVEETTVVDVEGTDKTESEKKPEAADNADSATETEDNVELNDDKSKEEKAEKSSENEEKSMEMDSEETKQNDSESKDDSITENKESESEDKKNEENGDVEKLEDKVESSESEAKTETTEAMDVEKEDTTEEPEKEESIKEDTKQEESKPEEIKKEATEKEDEKKEDEDVEYVEVEEFFVRYKNFSYLHCEWRTEDELLLGDKRVSQKIKRYRMKKLQSNHYFQELDEDELFNPDYVEVDRVLAESKVTDPATEEEVRHYLVKWRGLPYEESTWELEQDVDKSKIESYYRFQEPPPEDDRAERARPSAKEWKKLETHHIYKNNNKLREYQLEGVNWLTFCWHNKQNCILADEMGLGKTVQSITFIQEVVNFGIRGPFLVIVPLSTVGNWQREFETWTDINCIVYHGSTPSRNMLQEYELYYKDEDGVRVPDCYKFQALITTYEMIISDIELFSSIEWRLLIIDEAHRLKNTKCKLIEGLRCVDIEHKVLLTGTPLQNNIDELFSLLNFLEPKQFASSEAFLVDFGELKSETQVDKLKAILKPMMLRRLKEDVEKNLAAKEETIVEVELTNIQKKYYRAILEKNFTFLAKGGSNANMPNLMNTVMELRKCCNHPYLVQGAEEKILDEYREKQRELSMESVMQAMIQSSGKLVLVDKLLPKLKAGDHKVLIFSQMIRVLDILEDYLISKHYLYERLDGRIRGNIRQEAIDRFSKPESDRFVFLLCTRAGGLGINLTAADTVIIYDSDWNPQNDLQAQARCHRIGQTKEVKVYRLVTRNTYEREMFDRASLKLGLDKAVLQSMGGKEVKDQQQLSKKEIEELLKKGAYGALMDDDNQGDKFCEEDIDQILKRRTQVITLESGEKGSTFAKASFSMSENSTDIAVDDPEFWQKWAKKAELDMDEINNRHNLIIEMPRKRKQTARYGNQDMMDLSEMEEAGEYDSEDEDDDTTRGRTKKGMRPGSARNKGRRMRDDFYDPDEEPCGMYGRSEFFKVEKNVLVYGWGRWEAVLNHARFKRRMTQEDVSTISRAMLLYSLYHYKGDDRIKQFILDLTTSNDSKGIEFKNHSGLSAPVPRGRKGKKKMKDQKAQSALEQEIAKSGFDPESVLIDEGYKKHLQRHSNKVLLRVRLLYYIRQEVIGDQAPKVFQNLPYNQIDIPHPYCDGDPPVFWWDEGADRSLLIGIFKHGYEKYNTMRQDPSLCFLQRCGPPDSKAVAAEMNDDGDGSNDVDEEGKEGKEEDDEDLLDDVSGTSTPKKPAEPVGDISAEMGKMPFPGTAELNARLRRLITSYQRNHKKNIIKQEQYAKRMERRERFEAEIHEREIRKRVQQQRWSRREETDFYKTVSSFGIERERLTKKIVWATFRQLAHLEKKYDETLTEYFMAFQHMCMLVCKKFKTEEEAVPPNSLMVEPLTEERASKTLARVELLVKVREEVLWHPKLVERLKLCQASSELPEWWEPGTHDKELLIGAAKHGVARTEMYILHDPKLIFREVVSKYMAELANKAALKGETKDETVIKEEKSDIVKKEKEEENGDVKEEKESEDSKEGVKKEGEEKEEEDNVKKEAEEQDSEKEEGKENKENVKEEEMETDESKEVKKEKDVKEEQKEEDSSETEKSVKEENGPLSSDEKMPELAKEEDKKMDDNQTQEKKMPKLEESAPPTLEENPLSVLQRNINKLADSEGRANTPSTPGAEDTDDTIETKAADSFAVTNAVHWPKDKILFKRLEQICYCIEKGEWCAKKYTKLAESQPDSRSSTPSGTPRPDNDYILNTTEAQARLYQGDSGLKMTFHKKRRRRTKAEMEADRIRAMNEIMGASSDADSMSESGLMNGNADSPMHVPKPEDEWSLSGMSTPGSERKQDGSMSAKKRGRKRKIDKLLEAAAEAAAQGNQSLAAANMSAAEMLAAAKKQPLFASPPGYGSLMASPNISTSPTPNRTQPSTPVSAAAGVAYDADIRIPVISLEDGSRLKGDKAPRRSELAKWLKEHPGYVVEPPEPEEEEVAMELSMALEGKRRRRKTRLDPNQIDLDNLQGDENVSVINRDTGKKITGAKAPPLRYLAEWLDKNSEYDVESKWATIVTAWGTLPDRLHKRILKPSGRGRKPNSVMGGARTPADLFSAAGLSSYASLASAGLLSGYPKLPMGFGGLPGLGFNPMYAASLAGFGMMPGLATEDDEEESVTPKTKEEKKDKSPAKSKSSPSSTKSPSTSASSITPHPSFPLMYNPMLFNPLFAQSMSGFTLPTGLPTSFASLANQTKLLNGAADSDEESQPPPKQSKPDGRHNRDKSKSKDKRLSAKEILAKDLSAKHYAKDLSAKSLSTKASSSSPKDLSSLSHSRSSHSSVSPQDLSVKRKTKDHHSHSRSHSSDVQDLSAPMDFSKKSKSSSPSSVQSTSLLSSLSQIGKKKENNEQPMDLVKKEKPKKGLGDIIGKLKAVKEKEMEKPKHSQAPAGRSLLTTDNTSKETPSKSSKDSPNKDSSPNKEKHSPKVSGSPPDAKSSPDSKGSPQSETKD